MNNINKVLDNRKSRLLLMMPILGIWVLSICYCTYGIDLGLPRFGFICLLPVISGVLLAIFGVILVIFDSKKSKEKFEQDLAIDNARYEKPIFSTETFFPEESCVVCGSNDIVQKAYLKQVSHSGFVLHYRCEEHKVTDKNLQNGLSIYKGTEDI